MPLITPGRTAVAIISALGGTDAGGGLYSVGEAQANIICALGGVRDGSPPVAADSLLLESGDHLLLEPGDRLLLE